MKNLFSALQDFGGIQAKMDEMRTKMEELEAVGKSGGGMVEITMLGNGNVTNVTIKPNLLESENIEMLQDLLIAAFNHARENIDTQRSEQTQDLLSGLPLPKGFKLPF